MRWYTSKSALELYIHEMECELFFLQRLLREERYDEATFFIKRSAEDLNYYAKDFTARIYDDPTDK